MRAKLEQEKEDLERKKKEKKELNLDQVENLKERLNKHLGEIKKLFGVESYDDDDESDVDAG